VKVRGFHQGQGVPKCHPSRRPDICEQPILPVERESLAPRLGPYMPQIDDIGPICFKPVGVSIAEFSLLSGRPLQSRCTWRAWLLGRGSRGRCTVPSIRTRAVEFPLPLLANPKSRGVLER
jgi:hypothetical protein